MIDGVEAWRSVPVEPTTEMSAAGYEVLRLLYPGEHSPLGQIRVFEAMVAAAPADDQAFFFLDDVEDYVAVKKIHLLAGVVLAAITCVLSVATAAGYSYSTHAGVAATIVDAVVCLLVIIGLKVVDARES